jgi:hypothetical protein
MVPAMQVHLLNSTSAKPLVQRMGHHNLEFCLIVTEELRRTYFGAEILYRMFSYARKQNRDRRTGEDIRTDSRASNAEELTAGRQNDEGLRRSEEEDTFSLPWFPLSNLDDYVGNSEYASHDLWLKWL